MVKRRLFNEYSGCLKRSMSTITRTTFVSFDREEKPTIAANRATKIVRSIINGLHEQVQRDKLVAEISTFYSSVITSRLENDR